MIQVRRSAGLSPCGQYRYWLRRSFGSLRGDAAKVACFIMLNPSTADTEIDDPTIRRCMAFAKAWGCSVLSVKNLYAFRATIPADLWKASDPIGESNDAELAACGTADIVVAAWGTNAKADRVERVREILGGVPLRCLGLTKEGHPRHPLYIRKDAELIPFEWQR